MSNITRCCLDFCDLVCPPKPCPYPLQCAKPRSQNIQPVPSCTCSSLNGAPTDSGTLKSDPGIFLSAERSQKKIMPTNNQQKPRRTAASTSIGSKGSLYLSERSRAELAVPLKHCNCLPDCSRVKMHVLITVFSSTAWKGQPK